MRVMTASFDPAHSAAMAADRRWAPRKNVAMPATVLIDGAEAVSCIIRNTSSSGARIETNETETTIVELADRFVLSFTSARTKTDVACQIVRRDGNLLGVRYVGPFLITDLAPVPRAKSKGSARFGRLGS